LILDNIGPGGENAVEDGGLSEMMDLVKRAMRESFPERKGVGQVLRET
jgi:hypothetical protein